MKKILLVYPPFCTPASPPYSITNLYTFLKNNCKDRIDVLDLNLEFHKLRFPEFQRYYQDIDNWKDYDTKTTEYRLLNTRIYSENNKRVINNQKPEFFDELLSKIKQKQPDIIAFSIVYSSQAFYVYSLIKELKGFKCIIGGPAINEKLVKIADKADNEIELLEYIQEKKIDHDKLDFNTVPEFSVYRLNEYFTPKPVIPIKTTSTCYYKGCAFCSHFSNAHYFEYSLDLIKAIVINSKQKYFFIIDDMIHMKRLLRIAEVFKPLDIRWTCQLKPTKELDLKTLKTLRESGLTMIMWGIESGNDRVLKKMNKGTNVSDIEKVLQDSHNAGIKNIAYMMFGFPTETKEEFLNTIDFLKRNDKNIDLVSGSVFGLHKGTKVYNHPEEFGIKIIEEQRTVLEPKITYEAKEGLTHEQAEKLKEKYKKTVENINKYPKTMNFFREHMFCLV